MKKMIDNICHRLSYHIFFIEYRIREVLITNHGLKYLLPWFILSHAMPD